MAVMPLVLVPELVGEVPAGEMALRGVSREDCSALAEALAGCSGASGKLRRLRNGSDSPAGMGGGSCSLDVLGFAEPFWDEIEPSSVFEVSFCRVASSVFA